MKAGWLVRTTPILVSCALVLAASMQLATGSGELPGWVRWPIMFTLAKLGGDAAHLALHGRYASIFFYEDFVRELLFFVGLGLAAWGAALLAATVIGGPVSPALPAVAAFGIFELTRKRGL